MLRTTPTQARYRAPRGSLSREAIVAAALDVVERGGPDALTMRNVAVAVGARPMSLYTHVDGRDDLLDALFELVLGEIELPALDRGRWQDQLRAGASDFRAAVRRRPTLVPLIFGRGTGPAFMRATEHSLAILRNAGFDPEQALHAHRLVVATIFGSVMNEISLTTNGPVATPTGDWPMISASAPYLRNPDLDAAWDFAITNVILGLEAQLVTMRPGRRAPGPS